MFHFAAGSGDPTADTSFNVRAASITDAAVELGRALERLHEQRAGGPAVGDDAVGGVGPSACTWRPAVLVELHRRLRSRSRVGRVEQRRDAEERRWPPTSAAPNSTFDTHVPDM